MNTQHSSESARPVTPVPSLTQSDNTSPTTAATRSPVTPTEPSYQIQYVTIPFTTKQLAPSRGNRKAQQKMSRQPIAKPLTEKPLPSLPSHTVYDPDASFMNWDSTDDERGSKRVVHKVKQAFKPRPRPQAQTSNIQPRILPRNPDNVQNATPRSPPRPKPTRIQTSDSITASLRSTTQQIRAPSPLRPKSSHREHVPPSARHRPNPTKISSDKILHATSTATLHQPRTTQNPRASYRHSYDESSAIDTALASLRQLADRPRPSDDQRRATPRPSTATKPPPIPTYPTIDITAASAFLANEAREFTPPDTPTSAATSSSGAKPKKFQKLFQTLRERTSFRDLARGTT